MTAGSSFAEALVREIRTRRCSSCERNLSLIAFNRDPKGRDGLHHRCYRCQADNARQSNARKLVAARVLGYKGSASGERLYPWLREHDLVERYQDVLRGVTIGAKL